MRSGGLHCGGLHSGGHMRSGGRRCALHSAATSVRGPTLHRLVPPLVRPAPSRSHHGRPAAAVGPHHPQGQEDVQRPRQHLLLLPGGAAGAGRWHGAGRAARGHGWPGGCQHDPHASPHSAPTAGPIITVRCPDRPSPIPRAPIAAGHLCGAQPAAALLPCCPLCPAAAHHTHMPPLQACFVVHSPRAGERFVACGSEDHHVYVWDLQRREVRGGRVLAEAGGCC